jgi:hypothetical protein
MFFWPSGVNRPLGMVFDGPVAGHAHLSAPVAVAVLSRRHLKEIRTPAQETMRARPAAFFVGIWSGAVAAAAGGGEDQGRRPPGTSR